jgi:hypothetical protein
MLSCVINELYSRMNFSFLDVLLENGSNAYATYTHCSDIQIVL